MKLTVKDLSFSYDDKIILEDINLKAESGKTTFLLGPNGSGKSTLFKCILGHLTPKSGLIASDNIDLTSLSSREKARLMAYIPQSCNPSYSHTVMDITLMGRNPYIDRFKKPTKEDEQISYNALKKLGIADLADKSISRISGGELQLVLISRALAQQSKIIIMDEPTANLDYGNQILLLEQMKKLAKDNKIVIISSHNPQHAITFGDQVAVLNHHKIEAFGKPEEILTSPLLSSLYKRQIETIKYIRKDGSKTIFLDYTGEIL